MDVENIDIIETTTPCRLRLAASDGGRETLRSGKTIRFAGDVAVYGDVNAGAHIEPTALVFGSLRGLAHAGTRGYAFVILSFDLAFPSFASATTSALPVKSRYSLSCRGAVGFAKMRGEVVDGLTTCSVAPVLYTVVRSRDCRGRGRWSNRFYQGRLPA